VFRFLLWFFLISWLGRKLFGWLTARQTGPQSARTAEVPLEPKTLYRDPVCGTFVSSEISHSLLESGQTIHFCSAGCRDRYQAERLHAVRA